MALGRIIIMDRREFLGGIGIILPFAIFDIGASNKLKLTLDQSGLSSFADFENGDIINSLLFVDNDGHLAARIDHYLGPNNQIYTEVAYGSSD
jgi:hypothetical protein